MSSAAAAPPRPGAAERSTEPLRVLVVDDHSLLRRGLCDLLRTQARVAAIAQAADADTAVEQARDFQPHVIVLDVVLPGTNGIDVIPALLQAAPQAKVLMLSLYDDVDYVRAAFAAGASGYALKDAADVDLVQALDDVAAGTGYLHPRLGARLLRQEQQGELPLAALSKREQEIFRLLALGYTNRQIAEQLQISARTAETHRARIFKKLRLHSRAELFRYALDAQLLEDRVLS